MDPKAHDKQTALDPHDIFVFGREARKGKFSGNTK